MKGKESLTFIPESKGLKVSFYWYGLLMFLILGAALLLMARFDRQAVRKQENFLRDQQLLSASLTRLAWEDQLQSIRFQRSFLIDEVFLKVILGDMSPLQAKSILSPFVYNNSSLLGYCFAATQKEADPLLISAYRSTPSGNAAREFVESFRHSCDFPQGVTDLTENDPVFSLSGKILITPELKLMILVDPLIRWGTVPGYLLTVMDLSPFISRYVLPVVRGEDGAAMVIHQDGTIIQHKNMELLGKNLNDLSAEFPAGLKEVWTRMKDDMSGKGDFLLARQTGEAPTRRFLAWNSLRIGSERLVVALTTSEAEINTAMSDLRLQRDFLGIFLVLFLLLATLLFLRRRGELEARSSESAFRSIFNSAASAIAVLDREGRFLTGNFRWEEITGRPLEELRGVPLLDLGSPPSREEGEMLLRGVEQGVEFQRAELVFSENRAVPLWADVTLNRLRGEGSAQNQAYLAIATDISGLKTAEEQLKKNTLLLQRQKMELQKQTADQEVLLALFAQFSRAKNLEELFDVLSRHLPSILSYRNLFLWLRSIDDGENFDTTDLLGEIERTGQADLPREMKGIIGQVLSTGKPYLSGDLSADPFYIPHSSEARSIAFVPVAYRGTIWGAMAIDSNRKDAFGGRERDTLDLIGSYIALHQEELTAKAELNKRVRQLEFLHGVISRVARVRTNEDLFSKIVDILVTEIEFPRAAFFVPDPLGPRKLKVLAEAARSSGERENILCCREEAEMAFLSGEKRERRAEARRTGLAMPMIFDGKVFGVLTACSKNGFSDTDEKLLEIIAEHMATFWALNNIIASRRREALIDPLTEVWNRRFIIERLEEERGRILRSGGRGTVILVDLGDFKKVNDRYGHAAGDEVLRRTSAAISENLRSCDMIGRYGGDEFLIYLPDVTPSQAREAMRRLEGIVGDLKIPPLTEAVILDYGLASSPEDGGDLLEVVAIADRRMYDYKTIRKGRKNR
ncbi:hypothetical protein MASR2M79_03960 [Aminivibrio sp.]